jgi:hypothetical protein
MSGGQTTTFCGFDRGGCLTRCNTSALVFDVSTYDLIGVLETPVGTLLPAGISSSGQIGIAGQAKSALVDSGVVEFFLWEAL